ncbi:hypothetical protein ACHIPZ_12655 [Antrihabitans sp. NCIMB 15449]|uniref:Uncharacterized protein n=1 Tax=Antrihabitans spumae TaxID=3373370 RepID=A0ABW7JM13_9NOCA
MTQQIRDFHGVLKIRDRHIPGWSPNFDDQDQPGWPHSSEYELRHEARVRAAEQRLVEASFTAAQHLMEITYDVPPAALLALWREHGLRIRQLDNDLQEANKA